MKKNILSLFNFLLLCLIFSCSNLINGIDESNNSVFNKFDSTKEIVVTGKVVVKGAVPQNLIQPDNSQKTAMPQLNSIVSKYKIAATLLGNNDERTETIKQEIFDSGETDFSIALPFGNWILEGYALDSFENEILYGIFGTSESPTKIVSSEGATPPAINIQLSPVCNAEITGKANLKIDVTGAGIKSVEVNWNESSISKVQKFNNSDTTDLTEFYVTLADKYDNNVNKNAGPYEIQIIFYSNSDYTVPVFTCHELINIFSNLTTNEWKNSGSCSFISDGNFTLTRDIVNKRHYYYINQNNGNDTNDGSSYSPLKHIQTAVDRIIAANDGDDYTIFLMDNYMADGTEGYINDGTTPSVVYINNSSGSKPLTLKIQSQKNIQYKINANNKSARVIYLIGGEGHKVSLTLQNIEISGGEVESRGAGILAHDYTDLTISNNVTIKDNNTTFDGSKLTPAANYGGAGIYSYQADSSMGNTLTIDGSNIFIEGNKSVQYGGGIYVNGCGKVYISGSAHIDSNTAKFGAGIALLGDIGEATIDEDVVIQLNTGKLSLYGQGYGGGIYADFNGRLDIKNNVLISENTCGNDGGGINIGYSGENNREINISGNVKIQKNSCGSRGGGIYIGKNASVIINGGTIGGDSLEDGNISTAADGQLGGGGIYIYTKGSLTLNDGKILNNTGITAHCIFNECGSFIMNGGYVYHDLSDKKHKCAVFNSRNGGTGSSYKIYMSGDAHINQQNTVSIDKGFPITLTGTLTQQTSDGVNIPSAVIEMQDAAVGFKVIENDDSGNNYVASNYNKFQYATTDFTIDEDGKLKQGNTMFGSKPTPDSVGDIVFSDGSAINYTGTGSGLTQEQKNAAVGIVFTTTYNFATGDNEGGSGMLMVGMHNTYNDGTTDGWKNWCNSTVNGFSVIFTTNDVDGSENWAFIKMVDNASAGTITGTYPAFEWAENYATEFLLSGEFASGWYIPSIQELSVLYNSRETVNSALEKSYPGDIDYDFYELDTVIFLSSSQEKDESIEDYQKKAKSFNFESGEIVSDYKNVSANTGDAHKYVLVVRKVE